MVYIWHKIEGLSIADLPENRLHEIKISDKRIGLLKRDQRIFAIAANCPHAGADLCTGWIDARGNVVCPLHSYRFDPSNGRNISGEGYKLFTYPVEVKDNEVFIGIIS
jgi:nitrite reductase/ring-hydroxylating ferredoxin subunit